MTSANIVRMVKPDAQIEHEGPVTPYRQLAEILRARIARGDWAPGRIIASENDLVQEYGLARTTVRRAIRLLVDEGVLFVVPHRATYVTKPA
jgi:GntR family transcriptional regulator